MPLVIVSKIWINEVLVKDILNNWDKKEKDNSHPDSPSAEDITPQEIPNSESEIPQE